jgi:protein-disulfide isomerase
MTDLTSAPVPPPAEDDHVRGEPGAPLVIVYADFTCMQCSVAADRLAQAPVRTCFRHLALRRRHPRAVPVARAAEAAARQGAFWAFHDACFAQPGRLEDPHLWAICERLGLDLPRFEADRRDEAVAERVERDRLQALRAGAAATPFLVAGSTVIQGAPDVAALAALG